MGPGAVGFYWVAVICGLLCIVVGFLTSSPLLCLLGAFGAPPAFRLVNHYAKKEGSK